MALIGNYSVLNKGPGRSFGGNVQSDTRAQWSQNGAMRGRYFGTLDQAFSEYAALPNGYTHPYCWVLPFKSGFIASYTIIGGTGTLTGSGAMGVNGSATLTGVGTISSATGALIVSAVAALTGSGTITTADANAILQASANITSTGTLTASIKALANAVANVTSVGTLTGSTATASGAMSANITGSSTLSPENLAAAVWNAVAAGVNTPGTMGNQVNFLYVLAHHKVVTDPATGLMTVYDTDNTTVLYTASLWENAAGSLPYDGAGAERRDKFA